MKKLFFIPFLFLSLYITAQNYGNYKLYASYNFEQDASDTQNNTILELKNSTAITTDAMRGNVLSFTSGGYAVMPAPIIGDTLSLAFWYKRSSSDTDGYWKQIFEFHNPDDDSNIYLMPTYGWDDSKSGLVCDTKSFRKGIWEAMVGPLLDKDNSWHHIVVVVSGSEWSYYVDGTLAVSKSIFGSLSVQNPTYLYFGMNPNRGDYPMACSLDDINIYHYPLSDSQVTQLYKEQIVTDPNVDSAITFHFDGNLNEEEGRIQLTGSGYTLTSDSERGKILKLDDGGQLNFSADIIPQSASTINFLYKKETISSSDNGKYIYQCSNNDTDYGIKLSVDESKAYLVLVATTNETKTERTGTVELEAGTWYGISLYHTISSNDKGTMRLYQSGRQTAALSQVETYTLGFDKWSLGSTTAAQTAAGLYDELIIEQYAMTTNEINSYYQSNLSAVEVTVNYTDTHQTIRNIGASDAWNAQLIGLYWPDAKKEKLAELLFSKEFDEDGNPKGIGLSCWRFNIGSGSAEQGDASYISAEDKRTECFLNSDLTTYNWDKQQGQQWFLKKAVLDYEVEDIIGFMNSPPVYFTKEGLAFNKSGAWNYILEEDKYGDYAKFTADIIEHFDAEGIHFDYISPVNEPQYQWNANDAGTSEQEGTPATDQEVANVVKALSNEFATRNLTSQIYVGEAGSISSAVSQIPKFWGSEDANMKIYGLPNVSNIVSAHSYWSDGDASTMYNTRTNLKNTLASTDPDLEFFQTEYSLLGSGYQWGHPGATTGNYAEIECAMSLARMLHADFTVANVTGWHWWTVFEQGSHGGEARFALIEALTRTDLTDGIYNDTKLLYTLGQYSRFIRPGMKRVGVSRSDNLGEKEALPAQMYSAYINEETKQIVVVATNTEAVKTTVKISLDNLPVDSAVVFTPYLTSGSADMQAQTKINAGDAFTIPPLSIVTFVSEYTTEASSVEAVNEVVDLHIYPNPATDLINVSSQHMINKITVYDIYGKTVQQNVYDNVKAARMSLSDIPGGIYLLCVETEKGHVTQKLVKRK